MIPILLITISNIIFNKHVFLFGCNHNDTYNVKFNQVVPMLILLSVVPIPNNNDIAYP